MLGSLVVTNNGSAGQVFDLSGVPREVQASDWNCYISYTSTKWIMFTNSSPPHFPFPPSFSSPFPPLIPSSTHSLPPTHTPHTPSLSHTLHTFPPSHTHSLPPTHTAHSRAWHYQHPGISTPSHWRAVSSLRQLSAPHPGQWSSPSSRSR